ncbi:VOC family protein [Streptomyces sp. NPDC000594]|uniref:VOC family protein n=1 Tax=Streptomyces sp. NPDC000594 TaxID=3154261 RepID=UPI00332DA1C7
MAIATLGAVALDCADARGLAEFYQRLLGGEIHDGDDDDWVELVGHGGTTLAFQQVPGHTAPTWPEGDVPQQAHLDLRVADLDAAQAEVVALGARVLDPGSPDRIWRVYADPAGHPFCLVAND